MPERLDKEGRQTVREQIREVKTALADVDQHVKEGVWGIGMEDAINGLQEQSYRLRRVYGAERTRCG